MHDPRKTHWEQVYRDKSPLDVSWYQAAPLLSRGLIHASGVDLQAPLIDVGGGASTLVDHLLAEGYTAVSVLDISAQALGHARHRLGARAGAVEWIEADITRFQPPHGYALWHDRAVFHFLTAVELGAGFVLLETRGETHRTPAGKEQLFNFFRFVKQGA